MPKTETQLRRRVRKGARLLDRLMPNWYRRIRVTQLDMAVSCRCIVGQLKLDEIPEVEERRSRLGPLQRRTLNRAHVVAIVGTHSAYGFDVATGKDEDYERLQAAWIDEIRARRKSQ